MYENEILEFTKEDGTVERKLLEQIFTVPNGTEYAALLALNEDGSWDDEQPIDLYRFSANELEDGEDVEITPIPSDMEYEEVIKVFSERIENGVTWL